MSETETRKAGFVLDQISLVEKAISHLDVNSRLNILGYCIAGYVVAAFPHDERDAVAKNVVDAIISQYLPAMADLRDKSFAKLATTKPAGSAWHDRQT